MNAPHKVLRYVIILLALSPLPSHSQWVQISGSYGGATWPLVCRGSEFLAGTDSGVFLSTNNGRNWRAASSGLAAPVWAFRVQALLMVGSKFFAGTNGGIFFSTDNGATWSSANNGLTSPNVSTLAQRGSSVFAGADTCVYCSNDTGATWVNISKGRVGPSIQSLAARDSFIFVGTYQRLYRSTNNGATWATADSGLYRGYMFHINVRSLTIEDSTVYATANFGVYKSTNNGTSWTGVYTPPNGERGLFCLSVKDSILFASNGVQIYRSTDGGAIWSVHIVGLPRDPYQDLRIYSLAMNDSGVFAGTTAGVLYSSDLGASWVARSDGLNASTVSGLAVDGSKVFTIVGSGYYLYRSMDNGLNWTPLTPSIYHHFCYLASHDSTVVVTTDGPVIVGGASAILRSTDYGARWDSIGRLYPEPITMNDRYILVANQFSPWGVLRCARDSATWTVIGDWPDGYTSTCTVTANDSNIYAGTVDWGLYHSPDDGSHWTRFSNGIDTIRTSIITVAVHGSTIFAGSGQRDLDYFWAGKGIYRTTDYGGSWTAANNGLADTNIMSIAIHDSTVLAGTFTRGVYFSTDNGSYWREFNEGLPSLNISALAINDSFVFAGILGGLWRRPLSEAVVSVPCSNDRAPAEFQLQQNFPNPLNPTTVIRYQLPVISDVKLVVYDILGRKVSVLVNERKSVGSYEVKFDASGLSSGVYLYRLQAGNSMRTRKMLLIR